MLVHIIISSIRTEYCINKTFLTNIKTFCACIINVSAVLFVVILLALNLVYILTHGSCVQATNTVDAVVLHVSLTAKFTGGGCKK